MLLLVEGTPQEVGGRCNFVIDRRTVGLRIQCSECCTLQGDPELHVIQLMPFSSTPIKFTRSTRGILIIYITLCKYSISLNRALTPLSLWS